MLLHNRDLIHLFGSQVWLTPIHISLLPPSSCHRQEVSRRGAPVGVQTPDARDATPFCTPPPPLAVDLELSRKLLLPPKDPWIVIGWISSLGNPFFLLLVVVML